VDAQLSGSYDLFRGGAKIFGLRQADAELDAAEADELAARFRAALDTESDYYTVLAEHELARVARERVRRADEQLAVARARVLAGAAVQTDSLQLLLELTRAQVELLRQDARLKVARLQLGRRVGTAGPVDAAPLDTLPASAIPLTEAQVAEEALSRSPRSVVARAEARAAGAAVATARGGYLPNVTLFGQISTFDDRFFPNATTRSAAGVRITVPIWNNAQREIQLSRAQTNRDVVLATRKDEELAVQRDAVEALLNYNTARASAALATEGVVVARENLRVQQERYRAGATTIIDLITAQVDLAAAEADVVQARHATRLALAGLEALLGRRLFEEPGREP
jgi:outer membrane protein TolC